MRIRIYSMRHCRILLTPTLTLNRKILMILTIRSIRLILFIDIRVRSWIILSLGMLLTALNIYEKRSTKKPPLIVASVDLSNS